MLSKYTVGRNSSMKWQFALLAGLAWNLCAADSWQLSTDDTSVVVAVEEGRPVLKKLGVAQGGHN
jgi:hypothetical protein